MSKLVAGLLVCLVVVAAASASGEDKITLTGVYDSGFQDGPRRLRAVFRPVEEGRWEVVFHFEHGGQKLTYSGTAEGNLTEGELAGEVRARNGRRFVFRGTVENGKLEGKHAELLRGGRESETGTLRMG